MRNLASCSLVLAIFLLLIGSPVWAQDDVAEILASRPDEAPSTETGIICLLNQVWYELIPAGAEGENEGLQRVTQRSRILAFPGPHYGSIGWATVSGVKLSLVFARVIHTDGSVTDLEPNETVPRLPVFSTAPDGTPRSLDFSSLSPGDVLEYEVLRESASPAQFFWTEYPFSMYSIPVLRAEIEVTVPDRQFLVWDVNGADAGSVSVETSESGQWLRAVIDEIPVWGLEFWVNVQLAQQDFPSIVISSVPSWQELVDCLHDMFAPSPEAQGAIGGLAVGLSYESSSLADAIDRIASFASDLANAAEVWDEPNSDELWRTLISVAGGPMLIAMLEQAGVHAHLAFASSSNPEPFDFDTVPALSIFADRLLTAIPNADGSFRFIDPLLGPLWRMTETAYEGNDLWVLDGSNDGQGQIVHIPRSTADENTVRWDLHATMPSECRLEVVGTITATGRSAYEWSQRFTEGNSDSETFASLWPGEPTVGWAKLRPDGANSWVKSLRVVSVEIGDPFVAEIAFERDFSNFGNFVDLTYFPGIETDISRLASVSTYSCEGVQAFNYAYPMTWSSELVVTPPSGRDLEISASNALLHGPVRYDMASVWDGESLVLSRSVAIESEIDETSCDGLSDIVAEIVADELRAWFRFLP
jgi:Domain of Unknown Function with PDB structure (DUF3857)